MKQFIFLCILGVCIFTPAFYVSALNIESSSIKELKNTIKDLDQEKRNLQIEWDSFLEENSDIGGYIKEELSSEEKSSIQFILEKYYQEKNNTRSETQSGTIDSGNEILKLRIQLYKDLIPYIDPAKKDGFLEYIKKSLDNLKDQSILGSEIQKKQEILDKKVSFIKEKIEENNKRIDQKIQDIVDHRISEKIDTILSHEKFKLLTQEEQIRIFQNTLEKIQKRKAILSDIFDKTTLLDKKIQVYTLVEQKLISVIESLK